jgi:hypothetical protein
LYNQIYLFKDIFLFFCKKLELSKQNDFLKFLKTIVIIKPIQNSKPANANKKKVVDVKTKSSLIVPVTATYKYKTTHIISEYKTIVNIFLDLNKKNIEVNQNINVQKLTQVNTRLIK